MTRTELLIERDGPCLTVTFNRPEARNAMTWAMYDGLLAACEQADADPTIRVMLLRGAGNKAFVAGTDISQFQSFATPEDALAYENRIGMVLDRLEAVRKPVIAAIAGYAVGGGAAIALACDLRYCTPESRFGVPIARTLGNCLSMANYDRLVRVLGAARTKELIFRAQMVEAEAARQVGLVNGVFDADQLHPRVQEIANEIAANAPITIEVTKEAVRLLQSQQPVPADDHLVVRAYMSEDFREGVSAFMAKRQPTWQGR